MIVRASAPSRIGLFGGGTDLPVFYEQYGGFCINAAINIRQHIEIKESPGKWTFPAGANRRFYQAFFDYFDLDSSKYTLKASYDGIIESGLGSSAAAAVALVGALSKITSKSVNTPETAWRIEVENLGLYGGKQDQYAAYAGGVHSYYFVKDKVFTCKVFKQVKFLLNKRAMLFDLGKRQKANVQEKLRVLSKQQEETLVSTKEIAMLSHFLSQDHRYVDLLMKESWKQKKQVNTDMTNKRIDMLYNTAIEAGASAGKLCGSGSGGHMLFLVDADNQNDVIEAMNKEGCRHVDFSIDSQGLDVRVIS